MALIRPLAWNFICHKCGPKKQKQTKKLVLEFFVAQWVKDPALLLQGLGLLLWRRLDPWPRNLHVLRVWQKKKGGQILVPFCFQSDLSYLHLGTGEGLRRDCRVQRGR